MIRTFKESLEIQEDVKLNIFRINLEEFRKFEPKYFFTYFHIFLNSLIHINEDNCIYNLNFLFF